MEVRFIFLHPPSVDEILFATPLIRSVVKQVENAQVFSAVPEGFEWVLDDNPYVSSQIVFNKQPSKNIQDFRDLRADYLIDLYGERTAWFKNRLRVMDFSLKRKIRINIKDTESKAEAFRKYRKEVYSLLSVFDLEDDGNGLNFLYAHNSKFVEKAVPESFQGRYAMFDLPEVYRNNIDFAGPLSDLISRIERPIVLNGKKEWIECGEEVMRRTGCTILSTCGNFDEKEQVYLRAGANVLINLEPGKDIWSLVLDKPCYYFDLNDDPDLWHDKIIKVRELLNQKDDESNGDG